MPSELTKYDLQQLTDYLGFESFSNDLMSRGDYKAIQPLGGFKDKGRDAIHVDKSNGKTTIFVYSVREDWSKKLEEDLTKIRNHQHTCDAVVFVTTSDLTATAKDNLKETVKTKYGWELEIFDLERIALLVDNHHEDLKSVHRGIFRLSDAKTPHPLPEGLQDLSSIQTNFPVVLPDCDLTFPTALTNERVFERNETTNVVADLIQVGHALIVGNSGTGKTIMAFQAAKKLESSAEDNQLQGLKSYYCTVSDCQPGGFLNFLDDRSPSLLLVDNAEEDELTAYTLLTEWRTRRKANKCEKVFILFISESHYNDENDPRPVNLFHEHPRTSRALPSDEEFEKFVSDVWPTAPHAEYSQKALRTISRYTGKSLALAVHAITATLKMIRDGNEDEFSFRRTLLGEIKYRRKLTDVDSDATRACVFSYYNIPIRIKAFGEDAAKRLFDRGFLVYSTTSKAEMQVFSRSIGELWFEEKRLYRDDLVSEVFDKYLEHEEANYEHVLAGLHKSGHLSLLGGIVNDNFQLLHDRIDFETDLRKTCIAVESVSAFRRSLAIQLLAQSFNGKAAQSGQEARLGRALHVRLSDALNDHEPHVISRYVNVVTHHLRRIFVGGPQADSVRLSLEVLKKVVSRESTSLSVVARLCEGVARSNRDAARNLVGLVVSNTPATIDKRQISTEDRLIFAGAISWFDREHSRQIFHTLNSAAITSLILGADSPKTALQLLSSVESLDHRVANTVVWGVIRSRKFSDFAQTLIKPPTSLYEISRLIVKARDISFRAAIKLVDQLLPALQQAIKSDKRLSALGFMLSILRRTNGRVAGDMLLAIQEAVQLNDLLSREAEPMRFAKTLLSIYGVDRNFAGNFIESADDLHWIRLFGRCRNLTPVAFLLRAVALSTFTRDTTVEKILNISQIRTSIQQLGQRKLATRDLANYATIVALACPVSPKNKSLLLSFISKGNFEDAINDEEDPRRAGEALRAYVAAFPVDAYKFANGLVKKFNLLKSWIGSEDLAAVAYLLHSAAEVDGRLSDALGERVDARNALAQLQLEPRGTRIAEYLHAVSLVAPLKAQRICRGMYGNEDEDKDPLQIIQEAGDLRKIIKILAAIRTSHSSFYKNWLRQFCHDDKNKAKFKTELAYRTFEESNLSVLSILFGQIAAFDWEMACDLIYGLELDWVIEAGLRDSRITEILQFIASVVHQVSRDTRDNRHQVLAKTRALFDASLGRIGEIRSVRALGLTLVELFRVAAAFDSNDYLERGWNAVSADNLCNAIKLSDDVVGCGLLSLLLTQLQTNSSAKLVMTEADAMVRSVTMDHPVVPSLFALALTGASYDDLKSRNVVTRVRDLGGTRTWEIGFANWLIAQRGHAEGKDRDYPTIGMEVLQVNNDLNTFNEEFKRAGGNLRYAFVLALFNQLNLHQFGDADELIYELRGDLGRRVGSESRYWVRNLLDEFGGQLNHTGAKVEKTIVTTVAQCVRDLSPRTEAVPGVVTGDEQGQGSEAETWDLLVS